MWTMFDSELVINESTQDEKNIVQPEEETSIETSKDNLENLSDEDKVQDI